MQVKHVYVGGDTIHPANQFLLAYYTASDLTVHKIEPQASLQIIITTELWLQAMEGHVTFQTRTDLSHGKILQFQMLRVNIQQAKLY